MRIVGRKLGTFAAVTAALAIAGAGLWAAPASAQSTLEAVKKRDQLICGANGQLPGFSVVDDRGNWQGLDVDLCRAASMR